MTKEEYRASTSYSSVEEAAKDKRWVTGYSIGIILYLFTSDFIQAAILEFAPTFVRGSLLISVAILVGYVVFCYKIIQKTKNVTKANILFSFCFAPLSWIWFLPQLLEPLEIIIGERMPPAQNLEEMKARKEQVAKESTRNALKTVGWAILIGLAVMILLVLSGEYSS